MPSVMLAVLLVWAIGSSAAAQDRVPAVTVELQAPATSCGRGTMAVDTTRLVMFLAPAPTAADSARQEIARRQVRAVAQSFRPPEHLAAHLREPLLWYASERRGTPEEFPNPVGLSGELTLQVEPAGRLRSAVLAHPLTVPLLNASLLEAAWRADSLGRYAPPGSPDSAMTVRIKVSTVLRPPSLEGAVLQMLVPFLRLTTPLTLRRVPAARYPTRAYMEQRGGYVTFEFVVGEKGRVEPGSLKVIHASDSMFIAPATEAMLRAEFAPARSGACPVPQVVTQRVSFRWPPPRAPGDSAVYR